MRKLLVTAAIVFASVTSVQAFCWQGSDINSALQYLVCLHNEQNDTLNQHADVINGLQSNITSLELDNMRLEREIEEIKAELFGLKLELSR